MKRLIFFALIYLTSLSSFGQEIYLNTANGTLIKLNIANCNYTFVQNVSSDFFDISFHPNGNFYGIKGSGGLFEINVATGATTFIYSFGQSGCNSMTISNEGLVYVASGDGDLWTYDLTTNTPTTLGSLNFPPSGDLSFYEGELYYAATLSRIVKVNLNNVSNSQVVVEQNTGNQIFGIVSNVEDCVTSTYAVTFNGNGTSNIYLIDFEDQSLSFLCTLNVSVYGGASEFEFLESNAIRIDDVAIIAPTCNESNGSVTLDVMGGEGTLMFSLDGVNFQTSNVFSNIGSGDYTLFIQDEGDCVKEEEIDINALDAPSIVEVTPVDAQCGDANSGQIIISETSGGIGAITYSIDGINFQANNVFENVAVGTVTVSIQDTEGCTDDQNVEINLNLPPVIDDVEITHTACGLDNASIIIQASGDGLLYSLDNIDFVGTNTFDDLGQGLQTFYIKDITGCVIQDNFMVDPSIAPIIDTVLIEEAFCGEAIGQISIEASGGIGQLQYAFEEDVFTTTSNIDSLTFGLYTIWVKDDQDCIISQAVDLIGSPGIGIAEFLTNTSDCDVKNGRLKVVLDGGTAPFTAYLDNILTSDDLVFIDLNYGTHDVVVVDDEGCSVDSIAYIPQGECTIFIPTAFSPNGDGENDFLEIFSHPAYLGQILNIQIFDRWGALVYKNNEVISGSGWDGTQNGQALNVGVYMYFVQIRNEDGTTKVLEGDVTLLR